MIISAILATGACGLILFDFMSLLFFPAAYYNLHYMCNDVDLVKISSIQHIDDFQCNISVVGQTIKSIINSVPCALYDKPYNNTLVKFNHYNPNECFEIISSKNDVPKSDYREALHLINLTYTCWIITVLCGITLFIMNQLIEYIDRKDIGMEKRELDVK